MTFSFDRLAALLASSCLVAWAGSAAAQEVDHVASGVPLAPKRVSGVVVTGVRTPPVARPFTESVVAPETIANLSPGPTVTAQTILNREPSVIAFTDGPFGVRSSVYLRAFNSSQFSETYDGVALNDVFNGGVTGAAENVNNVLVTPNNFEAIEVYRGINDPAVNSYNSLGGTINYLPKQPSHAFGGEAGVSYGSFNTLQWHATLNTGDLGGLRQIVSINHGSSDGWLKNTSDRNTNVYYGATYDRDNGDELSLNAIYNRNVGYTPNNMPLPLLQQYGRDYQWPTDYEHHAIANTSWMAILGYKAQLASNITFENKVFGGYDDYQRTSFSNPLHQQSATQPYYLDDAPTGYPFWLDRTAYPSGPTYDPAALFGTTKDGNAYHYYGYTATGWGDTPTLTLSLPHNEITVGGNVTTAWLHSREYWYGEPDMPHTSGYNNAWDEHDSRTFASAYVQDRVALVGDRLHVTGGLKWVYANTTNSDDVGFYYPLAGTVHDTEHYVSPTLGANFQVVDGVSLYAAYGQNIKFPDISAYYSSFQTDANGVNVVLPINVKPEYVDDYEVGAKLQRGGLFASLAFYREDFKNTFFSSTDPNSGLSTFHNGGTSRYQGEELQVTDDFGEVLMGDLTGHFNIAHNEAKFTSSFNSDYAGQVAAGQPLAGVPDYLTNLGAVWSWNGWRVEAEGRYVGKQYVDQYLAGLPGATTLASYTVLNIGVSKVVLVSLAGRNTQVRFAVNGDNVTNEHYFNEAYSDTDYFGNSFLRAVPAAPASVTGSITVSF